MKSGRDLFGAPVDRHHGRAGRPRHAATDELRHLVVSMRRDGCLQTEIAARLRITLPTLRRHYRNELNAGSWQRRAADRLPS